MLAVLREMADRIIRECEDEDALDAEELVYLEQIKTVADLKNFTTDGSGKMVGLAADAAKALGQSSEWIAREIDGEFYEESGAQAENSRDFGHSGLGIGGLGRHIEETLIPSVEAIVRVEKMEAQAQYCKQCGESDVFDGAMFTTMAGSGYCDDCC